MPSDEHCTLNRKNAVFIQGLEEKTRCSFVILTLKIAGLIAYNSVQKLTKSMMDLATAWWTVAN